MRTDSGKGLLSVNHLSAGYGGDAVVCDVSFDVQPGEFCALLGRNGSGKTTLLKTVCGLIPAQTGTIKSVQTDLTKMSEKKRAQYISYIPQRHSKLIGITVLDAVLMGRNPGMGMFDVPGADDREKAMSALDKMGIAGVCEEDFSKLSEGQKQLVILARALAQDASVMLMDEPDSALDFLNKHSILEKIRSLVREESKAGLITLHDPNLALAYCDRLFMLKDGKIVSDIRPADADTSDIRAALGTIYDDINIVSKYIYIMRDNT